MKRISFCLIAFLCYLGMKAQEHEAHAIANRINVTYFTGQTVTDYVSVDVAIGRSRGKIPASLLRTSLSNAYTVLVDPTPSSNVWPRDFIAYYCINQNNVEYYIPDTIATYSVPSSSEYDFLFSASNNYGSNATLKPSLQSSSVFNLFAENTYALIINAVNNEYANYEEYWNECSFMYQTLTKRYNIPKSHIRVLMADGGSEGTISAVSTYRNTMVSLPTDLDGDGQNDVFGAATYYNIQDAIDSCQTKLTSLDHLFIFVVGDSEYDPDNLQMGTDGIAYLKLWNETIPPSHELPCFNFSAVNFAYGLEDVSAKTTMLLDISNSGDFVSNLEEAGFQGTVMTSGRNDDLAFHSTYPYGRFMYNWLCAKNFKYNIHSNTMYMLPFSADLNNNGILTMEEAFYYASGLESATNPYYSSIPVTWGKYMSFKDIARDVDLYIRKSVNDTGNEYCPPDYNPIFGSVTWNSPDIYLRNQQDGLTIHSHDTLDISLPGGKAYLYVMIRNDVNLNYPSTGQYLHLFWTDTRNLSLPTPRYTTVDNSDLDSTMYGAIATLPVASYISTGDSLLVYCEWNVPASIYSFKQTHGHLPPLSYIAVLSEHPMLTCNSLSEINYYANFTRSRKYAGLKAEFTHGYNSSLGHLVSGMRFSSSTSNTLALTKPKDSNESYRYEVLADNPDIHIETQEDDENIFIGLSGVQLDMHDESITLHVAKIEALSGICVGGVDLVLVGNAGNTAASEPMSNARISEVLQCGNKCTVTLTEPAMKGLQLCVEYMDMPTHSTTYDIGENQKDFSFSIPSRSCRLLNVSLIYKNKIIDSRKFIQ